jgi:uncharacterized caspase-like protein
LRFAAKDAEDLKAELERQGFVVTALIGSAATKESIELEFKKFMEAVNKDFVEEDVVLVFFSGHGLQRIIDIKDEATGKVLERVETPFFCPHDCRAHESASLVSLNNVIEQLKFSSSDQNILIVDACRNNGEKGSGENQPALNGSEARNVPTKVSMLFGGSDGQRSYESQKPEVSQGILTHALLQGLRGGAANPQGEIIWLNLATYVVDRVPGEALRLVGPEVVQQPNLIINTGPRIKLGEVELAAVPTAQSSLPPQPEPSEAKMQGLPNVNESWTVYREIGQGMLFKSGQGSDRAPVTVFFNKGESVVIRGVSDTRIQISMPGGERKSWIEIERFFDHFKQ